MRNLDSKIRFARGCQPKHRPTPAPTAIRIDTS
jgi:hypothetical protein